MLPLSLLLTACQMTATGETKLAEESVKLYCELYDPVEWSKRDTRETQEQNVANNKVYTRFCKRK